jgi:hypothetical protein
VLTDEWQTTAQVLAALGGQGPATSRCGKPCVPWPWRGWSRGTHLSPKGRRRAGLTGGGWLQTLVPTDTPLVGRKLAPPRQREQRERGHTLHLLPRSCLTPSPVARPAGPPPSPGGSGATWPVGGGRPSFATSPTSNAISCVTCLGSGKEGRSCVSPRPCCGRPPPAT